VAHNGLGLCDGGEFEAQMFSLAPKFDKSTKVQLSTSAPLLPNPVCVSSEAAFVMRAGLSMGEEEQPSPSNRLHAAFR
jgi:hypothetical protein